VPVAEIDRRDSEVLLADIFPDIHRCVVEVEDRADLEGSEIGVLGDDVEPGAVRVLDLPQGGDPDGRRELAHPPPERFELS